MQFLASSIESLGSIQNAVYFNACRVDSKCKLFQRVHGRDKMHFNSMRAVDIKCVLFQTVMSIQNLLQRVRSVDTLSDGQSNAT